MSRRAEGATLLVASTGGHLEELHRLAQRLLPAAEPREWVTFDDPQVRSLLAGEQVHLARYVPPRGYRAAAANVTMAANLLRRNKFARVVSTGSGIAIPFLSAARLARVRCHYIESAARSVGPSLTGKVAARIPGVRLYTQYEQWASARWHYQGSLFDAYEPTVRTDSPAEARRVVVTLGTMRTYGFERAVRRLVDVLPSVLSADAEILWQVGATSVEGLNIQARETIPAAEMRAAVAAADLVIAHAGIGSALTALDAGRVPVLLPRLHRHDEHVDDHQQLIADELDRRGLAVSRDPGALTEADLRQAIAGGVTRAPASAAFELLG